MRLYSIQTDEASVFWAGMASHRRQVLMGLFCPNLLAIFFDLDGNLISIEEAHLEFLQPSGVFVGGEPIEGLVRRYNIYDERIPERIHAWQQQMEFEPAVIRVRKFWVQSKSIGIQDHPKHFAGAFSDPELSQEERDEQREWMRQWDADGRYVLQWGNDYWLDAAGRVTSS
jgi:hypothetical protein